MLTIGKHLAVNHRFITLLFGVAFAMRGRRLFLAALSSAVLLLFSATPAYACSAGEDFNPVAESDIIVAGRVVDWQPLQQTTTGDFIPIQVHMNVEQAFKGNVARQIDFEDGASLIKNPQGDFQWEGASGACGSFDVDPKGVYVIMGLERADDGTYRSNRLLIFFIGSEPKSDGYEQALARMAALGLANLPSTGATSPVVTSLLIVSLGLLVSGIMLVSLSRQTA
jgi:hypothetical protein